MARRAFRKEKRKGEGKGRRRTHRWELTGETDDAEVRRSFSPYHLARWAAILLLHLRPPHLLARLVLFSSPLLPFFAPRHGRSCVHVKREIEGFSFFLSFFLSLFVSKRRFFLFLYVNDGFRKYFSMELLNLCIYVWSFLKIRLIICTFLFFFHEIDKTLSNNSVRILKL